MAMNNPYAAYQKFARNPMPLKSPVTDAAAAGTQYKAVQGADIAKMQATVKQTVYGNVSPLRSPANFPGAQATVVNAKAAAGPPPTATAVKPDTPAESADMTIKNKTAATTPASLYLENEVMTASPEKLTLMLYDGAIRFMNQALIHISGKNIASSGNANLRAQGIFAELMCTLNMDYPISKDLYCLYDFIKSSLIQANIKKDPALIREMITMTRDLRNTWAQAMQTVKR